LRSAIHERQFGRSENLGLIAQDVEDNHEHARRDEHSRGQRGRGERHGNAAVQPTVPQRMLEGSPRECDERSRNRVGQPGRIRSARCGTNRTISALEDV